MDDKRWQLSFWEPREPPFSWECPYCGQIATVTKADFWSDHGDFEPEEATPGYRFTTEVVNCPNPHCRQVAVTFFAGRLYPRESGLWQLGGPVQIWQLIPAASVKPISEHVPAAIRADYDEACKVAALSPKAAATLIRRCLQGMIRDFWGISKARLIDEVSALESRVDPATWKAINAVRTMGNVGAHMQRKVDELVDVEPREAELLIDLVRMLADDWYAARASRDAMVSAITEAAAAKEDKRQSSEQGNKGPD